MVLFWKYLKNYKGLLLLALILATINQVFSLLDPQIIRLIIDNYATKVNEIPREVFFKGVSLLILAFIGVALVSRTAKNFQDYFVNNISQRLGTDMYAQSVYHTFSLPYKIFEDRRSGEILQKLQRARTHTQDFIIDFINVIFVLLISILVVTTYAFTIHWSTGLTFLLLIPTLSWFMFIISKKIKEAQKTIVSESAELAGSTTETLRNVELVKSLGLENQEISRLNNVNKKILNLELKKIKLIRTLSFIQGTIVNAIRAGFMFLMLFLLFNKIMTLGEFFTLFFYSFFVFSPLRELAEIISKYQEAKASNEQLEEILKLKPQKKSSNPKKIEKLKEISFKNVDFKYHTANISSIKNISLDIKSGQTIAFAGLSGSGKTTIVKLILGLYEPTEGKLSFNAIDSKKIDYDDLRKHLGLVAQETQLFAGTIKENLLFVKPDATDKECLEALKLASITNILERSNLGLNTKIGEGGIKLSGGERQRLAIARALLRKIDLLIFDEATSNLDSLTDKEIVETIKEISRTKTDLITILVAHRLSTIMHADIIYVLEKGKIIEKGNHNDLLKKKGLYYAFWREQNAGNNI